ncbi:MAG: hypothetical protein H5U05_06980 [Candidatus Aminicenantes bacterium]|nr:hypothetical protein [Candidatus Aminicenantes bacterium]
MDDDYNIELMRLLNEQDTKVPLYYDVRRLTASVKARGYAVNAKRVKVLMWRTGLQAIYHYKSRKFSSGLEIIPQAIRYIFWGIRPAKKILDNVFFFLYLPTGEKIK